MAHGFTKEIELVQGETPTLFCTFELKDGQPLDLTGASITMTAKQTTDPADTVVFTKTLTITDVSGGKANVKLAIADTDYDATLFMEFRISYDSNTTVIKPKAGQIALHIEGSTTGAA